MRAAIVFASSNERPAGLEDVPSDLLEGLSSLCAEPGSLLEVDVLSLLNPPSFLSLLGPKLPLLEPLFLSPSRLPPNPPRLSPLEFLPL